MIPAHPKEPWPEASLEEAQHATIANANHLEQSKASLAPKTSVGCTRTCEVLEEIERSGVREDQTGAQLSRHRQRRRAARARLPPTAVSAQRLGKGPARDFDTVASAYSDSAGIAGADPGGSVGMPGQPGVQPLTLGPAPGSVTVGPATTGDGPPRRRRQPARPTRCTNGFSSSTSSRSSCSAATIGRGQRVIRVRADAGRRGHTAGRATEEIDDLASGADRTTGWPPSGAARARRPARPPASPQRRRT